MKKKFLIPELSICSFSAEDLITASGMTAAEIVEAELNTQTIKIVKWSDMTASKE